MKLLFFVFLEGTICAKKDLFQEKHSDALPFANLEVLKLLVSFKSKGYVRETFNWQWYYWYLTDEGIAYLRQYLGLPDDIVPATLKQTAQPKASRPLDGERRGKDEDGGREGGRGYGRGGRGGDRGGDRGEYRKAAP